MDKTSKEHNSFLDVSHPSAENSYEKSVLKLNGLTVIFLSLSLCAFQLYSAGIQPLGLFYQRPIHLGLVLLICFILIPFRRYNSKRTWFSYIVDTLFVSGALITGLYFPIFLDSIVTRVGFWTNIDIYFSIIAVITVIEASRRVVGWGMTTIGLIFLVYALIGTRGAIPWFSEWLPGILEHRGYSIERVVTHLFLTQEGIFGLPIGVAATFVFIFILFGAVLEKSGAGKFFIDIAYAATGRRRGGPAKAAVLASMGMGSITGSAIANVVTSGPFTIPLMKRLGYRPAQAAGIEAAASTGGQVMPPLMGAGAFLIAEYTGLPYVQIISVSLFPALLYFLTVYLFVHIIALKNGIQGLPQSELPSIYTVMRQGWHFLVPFVLLVYLLILGFSPMRVGFIVILSLFVVSFLKYLVITFSGSTKNYSVADDVKYGANLIADICVTAAKNTLTVTIACAVAGIIVGVIGLTGLGLKFTSIMLSFTGGNIVLALLLILLASLVLGFGLPVTASYIVMIILVGPALSTEFGIPLLIVHLVVFWYSQDSNVTPPVALAAIAASAISRSGLMESSFQAWKFAKGLYIIPLFMVFNPEFIIGGELEVVIWSGMMAFIGVVAFVATVEGYFFSRINLIQRILLGISALGCIYPNFTVEVISTVAITGIIFTNFLSSKMQRSI